VRKRATERRSLISSVRSGAWHRGKASFESLKKKKKMGTIHSSKDDEELTKLSRLEAGAKGARHLS